jgi:uncharacterized protein (DUF1778 family)
MAKRNKKTARRTIPARYAGRMKGRISIRVTEEEANKVKRYAKMSGQSVTEYVIQRCLYQREAELKDRDAG